MSVQPEPRRQPMYQPLPPGPVPPVRASIGKRIGAWVIDFAILALITFGIGWATYSLIVDSLKSVTDLGSVGLSNFLSNQGDWLEIATNSGLDVLSNVRLYAVGGLVAVLVVAAAYYWVSVAVFKRTVGMTVADVRLARGADPSVPPGWARALLWAVVRAVTDVGIFAAACVAPMFGEFVLAFLLWVVSVVWLLASAVVGLVTGRSLVERIGGVVSVPAAGYAAAARFARGAAASASTQAQQWADQAQGYAGQLQANERVQQTFTAAGQYGQQAADWTRGAMEHERVAQATDAGRRAADAGRRFAGGVRRRFDGGPEPGPGPGPGAQPPRSPWPGPSQPPPNPFDPPQPSPNPFDPPLNSYGPPPNPYGTPPNPFG